MTLSVYAGCATYTHTWLLSIIYVGIVNSAVTTMTITTQLFMYTVHTIHTQDHDITNWAVMLANDNWALKIFLHSDGR